MTSSDIQQRLKKAAVLCSIFILVELVGGIYARSLAILSDAAHLCADLASFLIAILAAHLASQPATAKHTFGLKKAEALAALFSVASLAMLSMVLAVEALRRLFEPVLMYYLGFNSEIVYKLDVDGRLMSFIASVGVLVNLALMYVLGVEGHAVGHAHDHDHDHHHDHSHSHETERLMVTPQTASSSDSRRDYEALHEHEVVPRNNNNNNNSHDHNHNDHDHHDHHHHRSPKNKVIMRSENINIYAAYLHVIGDLIMSISVLVSGVIVWYFPHMEPIDPICTLIFSIIVAKSTKGTFKSSLTVLLAETPPKIDWHALHDAIEAVPNVSAVHDLHVWSISHNDYAMSVHLNTSSDVDQTLRQVSQIVRVGFGIKHPTIQVQHGNNSHRCNTCDETSTSCANRYQS